MELRLTMPNTPPLGSASVGSQIAVGARNRLASFAPIEYQSPEEQFAPAALRVG
jgi:hypothetical protein